jgi:hypothetical protein
VCGVRVGGRKRPQPPVLARPKLSSSQSRVRVRRSLITVGVVCVCLEYSVYTASVVTVRMVHRMVLRCVSPINERQHGRRRAGDTDEVDAVAVAVLVGQVVPGWSKALCEIGGFGGQAASSSSRGSGGARGGPAS